MDTVVWPFAIMGFTFGMIAFTQSASAAKKIEALEERLTALERDQLEERL